MRTPDIEARLKYWQRLFIRAFLIALPSVIVILALGERLSWLTNSLAVLVVGCIVVGLVSTVAGIVLTLRLFVSRT